MNYRRLAIGMVGSSLLGLVTSAEVPANPACSCLYVNLCTEISYRDAIFAGDVLGIAPASHPDYIVATVAVFAQYKGEIPDTVDVITANWQGICGVEFQTGSAYLIFGNSLQQEIHTDLCTYTRYYDPNDPIIPQLTVPCFTPAIPKTWGEIKTGTR